ncbi:hypothetical protein BDZ89DRAFT_1100171 [Hymenopellis radicata]|nr:hypothetical protein BDZ89DRAFT_1100171 [Hymenopellis radicata]
MPKDSTRAPLPASTSDFALPAYSVASTSSYTMDDTSLVYTRLRRPSILAPKAYLTETRLASPLQTSFTLQPSPKLVHSSSATSVERSGSAGSLMVESASSSSSGSSTPAMSTEEDTPQDLTKVARAYRSPPRRSTSAAGDAQDSRPYPKRRLSFPVKQPRILNLLAEETRPVENEVKSEAAFQRLLASENNQPHTPRSVSDRGRYPEEAVHEDYFSREDTPSDDEDDALFESSGGTQPINIANPKRVPSGEDMPMSLAGSPSQMDVDILPPCSPRSVSSSMSLWRSTPPPTSAVRSAKRKLDDRFDPYPTKRRAVSPSISHLRDSHSNMGSPRGRLPIAIPVSIPSSAISSAASSPTMAGPFPRQMNITSSPTLRASMGLASPILRPLMRARRDDRDEREVEAQERLSAGSP